MEQQEDEADRIKEEEERAKRAKHLGDPSKPALVPYFLALGHKAL